MSAKVIRFPKKKQPPRTEETGNRLLEAVDIRKRLAVQVRLAAPVKERLARNLGKMFQQAADERDCDRLSLIKDVMFGVGRQGEDTIEARSLWQKRKRFIRFDDEPTVDASAPGEFGGEGQKFVKLAEDLASFTQDDSPPEQQLQRAILKLVDRTPFDSPFAARGRRQIDGWDEYVAQMERVLKAVQERTDLLAYFAATNDVPLAAETSADREIWTDLRMAADLDPPFGVADSSPAETEDNEIRFDGPHVLAPQVFIGHAYVPMPINKLFIPVLLEERDHVLAPAELRQKLERMMVVTYGEGLADDADHMESTAFLENYSESTGGLKADLPPPLSMGTWDKFDVFVSIEVERSTGQAKLFIGCHGSEEHYQPIVRIAGDHEGGHVADEPWEWDGLLWDKYIPLRVSGTNRYLIVHSQWDGHRCATERLLNRTLKIASEEGGRLAFRRALPVHRINQYLHNESTLHDWVFRPVINDAPGRYVPVPTETIAGSILRNLAYTTGPERLDNKLIENARWKMGQVDKLVQSQKRVYLDAISRFSATEVNEGEGK